eukprot:CAMPEP_0197624740 /NCGR_PEP_ID=MMETSP1338-20131121/4285_1 /TAXON_ID=43686 ORGANISM="Pelagodinium beii, Strain RCC1491" /NCGR_SAMPLE_ID=MMETSP1338 /ASSEMBLY_ACC=CAM_ASM_000754 /LENGTH=32 /DNA_ID= /DNA_START= /DNA_END= /DNA_ORIENTATION=
MAAPIGLHDVGAGAAFPLGMERWHVALCHMDL